jgi:hypothetical protein
MSSAPDAAVNRPHSVYRCYGPGDVLLYVGVAEDVEHRMFHHLHPCNVGKQPNGALQRHMARHDVEGVYPNKLAAREAERRAIAAGAPLLNKQHNPRRFRKNGTATYALVEPVHEITAEAFPTLPRRQERAA